MFEDVLWGILGVIVVFYSVVLWFMYASQKVHKEVEQMRRDGRL